MKKKLSILIFSISNIVYGQYRTIYSSGGETNVNWNEIMSEYDHPGYDGPPFWYECINAPDNAKASSTLSSQGKYNYSSKNIIDYDPRTAWVEGKSDYGIEENLSVQGDMFDGTNIYIYNGYQRSYTSWKNNSRVKKFKVYANNRPFCYLELKDKMGGQRFDLSDYDLYGKWIKFEIVEVYKGDKWSDVAISEIHTRGCCFNSNTDILNFNKSVNINKIQKGDEISNLDIETNEIKVSKVINSAKQIHHSLLKVSTENHTVELTPSHPLYIKDYGLTSLYHLKRNDKLSNYKEMIGKVEILVWNSEKEKSEYQKLTQIEKIEGEFETHTILKLENGTTYIANGFVT